MVMRLRWQVADFDCLVANSLMTASSPLPVPDPDAGITACPGLAHCVPNALSCPVDHP